MKLTTNLPRLATRRQFDTNPGLVRKIKHDCGLINFERSSDMSRRFLTIMTTESKQAGEGCHLGVLTYKL
jgi:hypothetical protein